ncbi:SagB/ThcOx family dehydrogenase [Cellulomonas sp. NPDC055163]
MIGAAGEGDADDRAFETYHEASKQRRHDLAFAQRVYSLGASPVFHDVASRTFKRYPGALVTPLPAVEPLAVPLDDAVARRRSTRALDPGVGVALAEVSRLLHLADGITGTLHLAREGIDQPVRAVPSGGALYPVETYLVAERVDGLDPGLYHYAPEPHALEALRPGSASAELVRATSDPVFRSAAATVVLTAVLARPAFKYGERAYRFALLEAGHVCQNLLLGLASAGLAGAPFGGFLDDEVHGLLDVDGVDEVALYLVALGHAARRPGPVPPPDVGELTERLLRSLGAGPGADPRADPDARRDGRADGR